jgi:acyl-CoA synthetase (NDP forming)
VDLSRLIKPRSIAIVGVSPEPGSPGGGVLDNLERWGYGGAIHLVSRTRSEVRGRPCVATIDQLPDGVDAALLMVPRAAIEESVAACARRGIGAAVVYAAGFAEAGGAWKAAQDRIAAAARAAGMAICGPNCIGIMNYVDGVPLTFSPQRPAKLGSAPGVSVVAQSGGLASVLRAALQAKDLPVAYAISTGNEAVLGLEDYVEFMLSDPTTRAVVVFAEQIRDPARFLALAARARDAAKPIVLLHPGRSAAARESARSHTGALAGDHAVIRALAMHHAIVMVESLEELIDVTELLMRCPEPPTAGVAVVTDSGAFKGMTLDLCESEGLDLPALPPGVAETIRGVLPEFIAPSNPLDLTAQGIMHLDMYERTVKPLMADPAFGSVVVAAIISTTRDFAVNKGRAIQKALVGGGKPAVFGLLGDEVEVPAELIAELRAAGVSFFRSPERALRALARMTAYGRAVASARSRPPSAAPRAPALPVAGTLPEYLAKPYLDALGLPVPRGRLARRIAEANAFADEIGFPVALKLQSKGLPHKSDAGGVILDVDDPGSLRVAWARLEGVAARAKVVADGVLVEEMAKPGVEMIVGGRRDPEWGPVIVVGLGGIWAEALGDVRVLPPDLAPAEIEAELSKLKGARVLAGMRGMPPRDVAAVARIAEAVGALLRARPEIREIDLNPVTVYGKGEGALALDALIVAE